MRRVLIGLLTVGLSMSAATVVTTAATATAPADHAEASNAAAWNTAASSAAASDPAGCDPIGGWRSGDGRHNCLLPFPNNYFTVPDKASKTGLRVNLNSQQTPTNRQGKPIDPTDINRADGFSVGAQVLADVPGMTRDRDLTASKLPTDSDIGTYRHRDAGVVVIDTRTGRRWPVWAEIDHYTSEAGPKGGQQGSIQHDLMIHPAVNFAAGTRYVVALRHLVLDNGRKAKPTAAFARYRNGRAEAGDPRTAHFGSIFRTLRRAGVRRSSLYLAWDFTTASRANTTGRLLSIRNNAFATLGDDHLGNGKVAGTSPTFHVSKVVPEGKHDLIEGSFLVPCYIAPSCTPTGKFLLGSGLYPKPQRVPGQFYKASFYCDAPVDAYARHGTKLRPSLYGHGLFGSPTEVEARNVVEMANEHNMLECATEWYGMAEEDVPNAVADLQDLSNFDTLVDRVQQGELDFLFLSRLMIHPNGFCSSAAFKRAGGGCVINRRAVYYDGNSQGGIYGGVVCAVETDVKHCVLGVTGEDYSVLLPRSSDYVATKPLGSNPTDPTSGFSYSSLFDTSYPDQSQRMLVLDLIQMLWDRGDPDGYAASLTSHPLPGTPRHRVLMQIAWGDHQVTNETAFTEARSAGARIVAPELVPQRYGAWRDPFWGLRAIRRYPYSGSALTVFDIGPVRKVKGSVLGTPPPPLDDRPNSKGVDPHEAPRDTVCGRDQKSDFLHPAGRVVATCGGPPYFAFDWNGHSGLRHRH